MPVDAVKAAHTPTGLSNADQLIEYADRRGLKVEVTATDDPSDDLLSGYRSVVVKIAAPCPERFKGTIMYNDAQVEDLTVFFCKRDTKGARAKWTSAYRFQRWGKKTIKGIKTLRRVYWEIGWMADDAERWQRLATEKEAEESK